MQSQKSTNIDGVLRLGRFTIFICIIAEFLIISQLGNMIYMVYAGAAPVIKGCGAHEFGPEISSNDVCLQILKLEKNGSCELDLQYDFKSVNIEFNYICDDSKLIKDSISVQMLGVVVGSLIFGQLSDSFGRKPILALCLSGCALFGILSIFSKNLLSFTIYRTIIGFFNGGQMAISLVYVLEIIPKRDRIWIVTIFSWSPNVVLFAVIAYYSANWKHLAIATSIITSPAILLCLLTFESPRWLIQKGRIDEAHNILRRITHLNGRKDVTNEMIDEVIVIEKEILREKAKNRKDYYICHLFHTRKLATYTLALSYSYLATSVIYYSMQFNMEKLSGSLYTNNILLGSLRYLINIAAAIADYTQRWFSRRVAHTVTLLIVALGFAINFIVICSGILILVSFSTASQSYITCGVVANELFPTPLRSISYSLLQVVSRAGVVIAPQLFILTEYWTAAPFLIVTILALADMLIYLICIPETKGRPLPDRISLTDEQTS